MGTDIAQVQHYRKNCPNILQGSCNKEVSTIQLLDIEIFIQVFKKHVVKDTTIWKMKSEVIQNVGIALKNIKYL